MLTRSRRFGFLPLVREVDPKGFVADIRRLGFVQHPSTQKQAAAAVTADTNLLVCGHHHTGKLTLLRAIGEHCERQRGAKVAYVSADPQRANRLDGYLLHHFIGLRMNRDDLPSQEQLEGTLERHVRLVESTYGGCFPSLRNADVLVLDSLESVPSVVLLSMDAVGRRQRGRPGEPFGGLRVFAAADWWRLPVHPTSDTGGYPFQLDQWPTLFSRQVVLEKTHGQDPLLNSYTVKALYGNLCVSDVEELERLSREGKPEASVLPPAAHKRLARSADDADEGDGNSPKATDEEGGGAAAAPGSSADAESAATLNDDVTSNADAAVGFAVRFPKQPVVRVMPPKLRQLKQSEMGSFLVNTLMQSFPPASLGVVDSLSVEVGTKVHLLLDGTDAYGVPGGAVGEVMAVGEHYITVYFAEEQRTVEVPRMRATIYHPLYPEVRYEVRQFPLYPRQQLCPSAILSYPNCYHVNLNGRLLADTNDLGCLLARMRSFDDFTLRNTMDFIRRDGVVHEPTRIQCSQLLNRPLTTAAEQWCRNCKAFVPTKAFYAHWNECVRKVRWCSECNKTVPLELLEPHKEKHQVVLCMDCGQAVEWRHWEAHRLSCPVMMREVSPDNPFLPLRTRQLALELGLDKRDLHTMKAFSRSMLPKSKRAPSP